MELPDLRYLTRAELAAAKAAASAAADAYWQTSGMVASGHQYQVIGGQLYDVPQALDVIPPKPSTPGGWRFKQRKFFEGLVGLAQGFAVGQVLRSALNLKSATRALSSAILPDAVETALSYGPTVIEETVRAAAAGVVRAGIYVGVKWSSAIVGAIAGAWELADPTAWSARYFSTFAGGLSWSAAFSGYANVVDTAAQIPGGAAAIRAGVSTAMDILTHPFDTALDIAFRSAYGPFGPELLNFGGQVIQQYPPLLAPEFTTAGVPDPFNFFGF